MTTTLRPSGPLQQADDGSQSRAYEVCVNSRPVGAVDIATVPASGQGVGTIRGLHIKPADRRRGRGTVAALAAEEVLRGWRCDRIQITVPSDAAAALRLATSLGYTERSRTMLKALRGTGPETPDGLTIRPMDGAEFEAWQAMAVEEYARSWTARGIPEDQARAKAEASHRELLPDGLATRGAHLRVALRDGVTVGHLWVGQRQLNPGERVAYVWDVGVAESQRGKGYGRSLMLCAERIARESGARQLGLHVFADNAPARHLYESLGYRATHVHGAKRLY
ncbi:GNAT family N-acetyltransferase [Streptomyces coeruleoprunus]|uniref:GNAT family N-acetyltransferase n=1 Tax=Streptomyces coeruleoprunus TaxID=285563 RepID=A0ABV9XBU3_9ACTN